jgi:aminoglycoside phosphotransferase (APT) family kinase protein
MKYVRRKALWFKKFKEKGWQINLWRWLQDENYKKWNDICISAQRYTLAQEAHDQIKWNCCAFGKKN